MRGVGIGESVGASDLPLWFAVHEVPVQQGLPTACRACQQPTCFSGSLYTRACPAATISPLMMGLTSLTLRPL